MPTQQTIPAHHGTGTTVPAGRTIKIVNTYGTQIIDTFAFTISPNKEIVTQMSMDHSRAIMSRTTIRQGDGLYNNLREKLFIVTEDTTVGHHDMLIPACDAARYRQLGCKEYHRNCADNLVEGLEALGMWLCICTFVTLLASTVQVVFKRRDC
jgi:uncharacterized protein YcgI (DUF1989 family)